MVLIYISLMISDVEHLFTYLLAIYVFGKMSLLVLRPFLNIYIYIFFFFFFAIEFYEFLIYFVC